MPNPNRGSCGYQSNEFEPEYDRPSKSELKRQMTALQKLGQELVDAPRDRVKRVPMPEDVRDAILECQTITNHEGRRRQIQFVGKKMRTLDEEEVALIQKTIDSWKGASKAETRNARKEQAENKPPKAYREIFQILKEIQVKHKAAAKNSDADDETQDDDENDDA
ncbi:MAG: DUF615 domain-containing protein [Burkholderiales bacterium]|nr:DUF615 domain-containing protein [Burkholderiales bacterium]